MSRRVRGVALGARLIRGARGCGRACVAVAGAVSGGVGAAVAEGIGRKVRDVAAHLQVLCMTHLAQIAVFADAN